MNEEPVQAITVYLIYFKSGCCIDGEITCNSQLDWISYFVQNTFTKTSATHTHTV